MLRNNKMLLTWICAFGFVSLASAMPLANTMVDLTYVYDETTPTHPMFKNFKIDSLINGTYKEFAWLQIEEFSLPTHIGTHMDAPSHFTKGGMTVDRIPVSEFIAPAAVIDISARADLDPNAEVTLDDLLQWEEGTGQSLNGTVLMIRSGWGKKYQDGTAFNGEVNQDSHGLSFPGIAPEACQWLVNHRSIKGIGIDTFSIDKGSTTDYMSHIITLGHGLYILENVANMEKLPAYGAKLYIFPMKIGKGSGAPTRIVASIPKIIDTLPSNIDIVKSRYSEPSADPVISSL